MKRSSPLRWVVPPAAVIACGVLFVGCGSGQSQTLRARVVRLGSLTMKIPSGWHVRRVQETCGRAAGPGILIADLSQRQLRSIHHPRIVNGCTTDLGMSGLGTTFAVASIDTFGFPFALRRSSFPLRLGQFAAARGDACHCLVHDGAIVTGGSPGSYDFRGYLGVHASGAERQQLAALVASIAPARRG